MNEPTQPILPPEVREAIESELYANSLVSSDVVESLTDRCCAALAPHWPAPTTPKAGQGEGQSPGQSDLAALRAQLADEADEVHKLTEQKLVLEAQLTTAETQLAEAQSEAESWRSTAEELNRCQFGPEAEHEKWKARAEAAEAREAKLRSALKQARAVLVVAPNAPTDQWPTDDEILCAIAAIEEALAAAQEDKR